MLSLLLIFTLFRFDFLSLISFFLLPLRRLLFFAFRLHFRRRSPALNAVVHATPRYATPLRLMLLFLHFISLFRRHAFRRRHYA